MPKTIETDKARQGRIGWQVLVVLVCALILAMVVWFGVGLFGSAIAPENPIGEAPVEYPDEPAQ